MFGNRLADTQFRAQDPPAQTDARVQFEQQAAREFRLFHRVTWAANKPSEHNAMNSPFTPAMVVRVYPGQKHSMQTFRILSRPIKLLGYGAG